MRLADLLRAIAERNASRLTASERAAIVQAARILEQTTDERAMYQRSLEWLVTHIDEKGSVKVTHDSAWAHKARAAIANAKR